MKQTFGLHFFTPLLIGMACLLPVVLVAQEEARWQVELLAGPTFYQGDLSKENLGTFRGSELALGVALPYRIGSNWQLQLNAHYGNLRGDDAFYEFDAYRLARQFDFETRFIDGNLSARYSLWANTPLRPYLGLGFGVVFFDYEANLLDNTHLELFDVIKQDLEATPRQPALLLPVSAGISYHFSRRWATRLGVQYNFTDTDWLDGVSWSGDPNNNDRYGQLELGLVLKLGYPADIDEDGIADEVDECPLKPGAPQTNGCPDSDGDGLRDSDDDCPLAAGSLSMSGCPDTDGDGTADPYDRCPALAGPLEALGCPPKDTDQDGTLDHLDECPLEAGPIGRRGCPARDTDRDGILDEVDACPEHYGPELFDGCPDSDGDGIEDIRDACPSSFGVFAEQGCPKVTSPSAEAELLAKQMLWFGARNANLTNFYLLDKLAGFLRTQPTYRVIINGHADGYGSEKAFNYLSQLRAERVKRYLQDSGVPEAQLLMRASGSRVPLRAERTPVAQALNRRVAFVLVK